MLIPFIVAFQIHAAMTTWTVFDRTTVAWRTSAAPYELLLEASVVPRDSDPDHRIRIRVPGRADFTVVDDRGPGEYVPVREALGFGDKKMIPRALPDSARVLVLPIRGPGGTTIVALFGYPYASDPVETILVGFDSSGYPRLLFRKNFELRQIADLDGDGAPELIGLPTISEGL